MQKLVGLLPWLLVAGCSGEPGSEASGPRGTHEESETIRVGLRRGDTGPDVQALASRLASLGYFPSAELRRAVPTWVPVVASEPAAGRFDEVLETGLRAYQQRGSLEVTGVVDAATAAALESHECGFPEFGHRDESWKFSIYEPPRWNHLNLTWRLVGSLPTQPADAFTLTNGDFVGRVNAALNEWSAHSPYTFTQVASNQVADIDFVFGDPVGSFTAFASIFTNAAGTEVTRFEVAYERWRDWRPAGSGPEWRNLQAVTLHELGHVLGLEHANVEGLGCAFGTTCPAAPIMWSTVVPAFTLRNDDIIGIHAKEAGYQNQNRNVRAVTAGGDGSVWTLGSTPVAKGYPISKWTASGGWQNVASEGAISLGVESNGVAWGVDNTGQVFFQAPFVGWLPIGSVRLSQIAVGSDRVFGLGQTADANGDYAVYEFSDATWDFQLVPGQRAIGVAVEPSGRPWTLMKNRAVRRRNAAGTTWELQGAPAPQWAGKIRAGANGSIWIVTEDSTGYKTYLWNRQIGDAGTNTPDRLQWLLVQDERAPLMVSTFDVTAGTDGRLWAVTVNSAVPYKLWRSVR